MATRYPRERRRKDGTYSDAENLYITPTHSVWFQNIGCDQAILKFRKLVINGYHDGMMVPLSVPIIHTFTVHLSVEDLEEQAIISECEFWYRKFRKMHGLSIQTYYNKIDELLENYWLDKSHEEDCCYGCTKKPCATMDTWLPTVYRVTYDNDIMYHISRYSVA